MVETEIPSTNDMSKKSFIIKVLDLLLKIGACFIILEPIWMLLPFAGFLYGSVMHMEFLRSNPHTSWLVHFVFPTHTLFPLGLILIFVGASIFLVGAFQIYSAKLFKKGLVKTGIYRKFRNPQYVALTLFGIGILLTWGRFITYISFFVMMWLYYFLSKSEERKCLEHFGDEYREYLKKTYFIFPGEDRVLFIIEKIPRFNLPRWAKVTISFLLVVGISIGSGFLIQGIRWELRNSLPAIAGRVNLSDDGSKKVDLLMIKGPVLQASVSEKMRERFMEKSFEMLTSSLKIREALNQLDLNENYTLLAFLTPGSNWHSGAHHDHQAAMINAFIVITQSSIPLNKNNFREFRAKWQILKLLRVQELCYDTMTAGLDPVEGRVFLSGPPLGIVSESFQNRVKEMMDFFLSGL